MPQKKYTMSFKDNPNTNILEFENMKETIVRISMLVRQTNGLDKWRTDQQLYEPTKEHINKLIDGRTDEYVGHTQDRCICFYKSHIQGEIERIMRLKDKEMEGKGQMREKKTCIQCKLWMNYKVNDNTDSRLGNVVHDSAFIVTSGDFRTVF